MKRRYAPAVFIAFCVPFILAYVSWAYFPLLASWIVMRLFNYSSYQSDGFLWSGIIRFLYSWYTFVGIGVAGVWIIAAALAKKSEGADTKRSHPAVSFIVPAYNEEENVPKCIRSIFRCTEEYDGPCEVIVVDDGSFDLTYETAWAAIRLNRRRYPQVRAVVVRHSTNLGKVEAIRTGLNKALGSIIAVVDADSFWMSDALTNLVDYMLSNGKGAVTGYIHPSDGDSELNPYVVLQQIEYSQGLGVARRAQSLGNSVLIVSGAIGLYDSDVLRKTLEEKNLHSVTEDLEITLEISKSGRGVGYVSAAKTLTIAPFSFKLLWRQRLRWFIGWLHNAFSIHKDLLLRRSWVTLLLWYCHIFEYGAAFVDLFALAVFPLIFWFSPDHILFVLNILIFMSYSFVIGVVNQAIALKYAYNNYNYKSLLLYTPFYPIFRMINMLARSTSLLKYCFGHRGNWHNKM